MRSYLAILRTDASCEWTPTTGGVVSCSKASPDMCMSAACRRVQSAEITADAQPSPRREVQVDMRATWPSPGCASNGKLNGSIAHRAPENSRRAASAPCLLPCLGGGMDDRKTIWICGFLHVPSRDIVNEWIMTCWDGP